VGNTIVAFSAEGEGVSAAGPCPTLRCCDLFGNAGGDWIGCLAEQLDPVYGNISEDPLFCDPATGDLHLREDSPCAPFSPSNPDCDLVGAWPVGCESSGLPDPFTSISSARDRPAWIQVLPNPCRHGALLRWRIPDAATATLRLTSVSGRVLLTQRLGGTEADVHESMWRAVDPHGMPLPSGVYTISLFHASGCVDQRVLVIR
jgi:hypothetical protein